MDNGCRVMVAGGRKAKVRTDVLSKINSTRRQGECSFSGSRPCEILNIKIPDGLVTSNLTWKECGLAFFSRAPGGCTSGRPWTAR